MAGADEQIRKRDKPVDTPSADDTATLLRYE